ncbi:MAG: beta-ketoacyl-[acyl-carrier-protein] synthase family protein [Saprospiraceae bacterium]|nr:beta-ketoacyl-[acyl-carrier-protein] synthase family protein [Saprospiraceae bacterium]MCB9325741.1 beta-ketoacyl-[acyl-carrier-protein] synthase family protein [Lewinellaceae bacterium]
MAKKVFITGMGVVCSLGMNKHELREALLQGKSGVSHMEILSTKHRGTFPVGEIKWTDEELSRLTGTKRKDINRTSLLGLIAAREAVEKIHIPTDNFRLGLISGTTVGGMDFTEKYYSDFMRHKKTKNFIQKNDCGFGTEFIAGELGNVDFFTTVTTACSSSLNSMIMGANMIQSGKLDAAIVGGTDALSKFTINGFNSLLLLDREVCRPFDDSRNGINLGEGAAFLVIESEASLQKTGNRPIAVFDGFGNANDAYHPGAISDNGYGIQLSMQKAIHSTGLPADQIDYVLTHGTATKNNDVTEGAAIKAVFGENTPAFCSLKSSIGHTLGASGAINAAISLLAMETKSVFPNRNFTTLIPELGIKPVESLTRLPHLDHVLVNAVGMGGFCSSVVISSIS